MRAGGGVEPGSAGAEEPGGGAEPAQGGAPEGRGQGHEPAGTLRTAGSRDPRHTGRGDAEGFD